ncbi:unnamed protein product [Paramecium sonneborni]|uniref:Ubiquitin-like protease family profile domain-containing protein n=1 Tax=Paramecium sonneborni TaxID=65129 RepID=A0A8S1KMD8_9CILI|nr:unnamed protein product [Paramecium sonneborni]
MVLLDPIMLRDFKNRGYDVIDIRNNSDYVKLMIQINIIFYLSSNQSNINNIIKSADYQHQVRGKLYSSFFDSNKNPKYITQEGEFFVDLKNNLFQLNGQGIKYSGKSNNVNEKGEYNKGIKIQTRKSQNKIERKSQSIEPKTIKIFEVLNGKLILRNQKKILSTWCKYNQQISLNDLKILRTQGWLTSSIIDSYVLSLNLESQKKYFALNYKERQHIKKIFLVPTSLVTNIGGNYNMTQAIELFQSHFLELQEIKFEFQIMYTKIGFPINSNNVHWYFLLFDLEKNEVEIYDSLSPKPYSQILDLKIISELLMLKSPKISFNKNNYEQKDSYSCGYHVCHFMKFCHEKQFQKDLDYQYDENQMRLILKQVIEDEEN